MAGRVSWTFLLLLVAHICFSANPLQATPIEDIDPQLGAVEEDADFPSSSSSKGVEPIADIPPEDDSMLHDELSPAREELCYYYAFPGLCSFPPLAQRLWRRIRLRELQPLALLVVESLQVELFQK
ncbi:unnamed protein product [Rodentolepis nana]|uniref:Uncharacterized protein n=1 Tax=Rodentolepis nana TaxID=102285 RepID=A0A0R3TE57_RODNA|nr:unnamed protein product [Rodentolepis nana]